jgi:hypothetical protein
VHDEFLVIGKPKENRRHVPNVVSYEAAGNDTFFSTHVLAPRALTGHALVGPIAPAQIWLNGEVVTGPALPLKAGANALVLRYTKPGRTYFVVSSVPAPARAPTAPLPPGTQPTFQPSDLAMSWSKNPHVLPFDVRALEAAPVGWYRFVAPPGLRAFTLTARGQVQAWADGAPLTPSSPGRYVVPQPSAKPVTVRLRIAQDRGCYGGAALPEPIRLECNPGEIALGDWAQNEGLAAYSGGAWYRKTITLTADQARGRVSLDLGHVVASAEVRINGQLAGIRVAPPWTLDVSRWVKPGANRLEVLVCNTLANHYVTIPTRYRGELVSGLVGPVTLISTTPTAAPATP